MTDPQPPVSIQNYPPQVSSEAMMPQPIYFMQSANMPPDEGLSLIDVVRFLREEQWRLLAGLALGALVAGGVALLVVKKTYEASATLIMIPPSVDSKLAPNPLSVQAYQQLLQSDAVIQQARAELLSLQIIDPDEPFVLGRQLQTRIFISKKDEGQTLAPMLQVVTQAAKADVAATVANTWVKAFFVQYHQVAAGALGEQINFVDQQFSQVRVALANAEAARTAVQDTAQLDLDALTTTWDQTLAEASQKSSLAIAAYQDDTKRQVERFQSDKNLSLRAELLAATAKAMSELQNEMTGIQSRLEQRRLELSAVTQRVAEIKPTLLLRKAITDEALWQQLSSGKASDDQLKRTKDLGLVTEQVNPVYQELQQRLASIQIDLAALEPREAGLRAELAQKQSEMQEKERALRDDQAALDALQRQRAVGLEALQQNQGLRIDDLKRQRQKALDAQTRSNTNKIAKAEREYAQAKTLYEEFAAHSVQSQVAKARESRDDVRLGVAAVPPVEPLPSRRFLWVIAGAFLGGGFSLVASLLRRLPLTASRH